MMRPLKQKIFLLAFTIAVTFPVTGYAAIHVADSLEWMSMRTPCIVRAKVVRVEQEKPASPKQPLWSIETVTLDVQAVFKAPGTTNPLTFARIHTTYTSAQEWMDRDMIFFLRPGKDEGQGVDLSGKWVLAYDYPYGPIDLSAVDKSLIVLADMTVPKSADQIAAVIRRWVKHDLTKFSAWTEEGELIPKFRHLISRELVPEDSEAFKILWSGSSCYLIVPTNADINP